MGTSQQILSAVTRLQDDQPDTIESVFKLQTEMIVHNPRSMGVITGIAE